MNDQRISNDGIVVIKAQRYRSQDKNRDDALRRLQALVDRVSAPITERKPTKPTRGSEKRRREQKIRRGRVKALRGKVTE
jgi:ribosome-associated protein